MKTRQTFVPLGVVCLAGLAWAAGPLFASHGGPRHGLGPAHSWESFAERHDVDGDGRVTEQELYQTLDHFEHLDDDGDGFVTEADFQARLQAHAFGMVARRADAGGDGDGAVTPTELDAWFSARDTNDDGRIDAGDFDAGRRGDRSRHGGLARALDADGDGGVTAADLQALAARYDADGDGMVSAGELPEAPFRHKGRGHRHGPGRGPAGGR